MEERKIHSIHIFIFPFRWRIRKKDLSYFQDDKTALETIDKKINKKFWGKFDFEHKNFDDFNTYNEYTYYYPHVRDILRINDNTEDKILNVLQYQYNINNDNKPIYKIFIQGENNPYELEIEDIILNIYPHGVGMFVFQMKNFKHQDISSILKINDYGRRIFPQYLDSKGDMTSAPKSSFLADKIEIENISTEFGAVVCENFDYFNNFENLNKQAFQLPEHIGKLLGLAFYNEEPLNTEVIIYPILDDRMFVISYFINSGWMHDLRKWMKKEKIYKYQKDTKWYQYIFIDGKSPSVSNRQWLRRQLKDHTYARWLENGQIFGISRYSFVALVSDEWFQRNIISKHVQNQYFQLVLLSLLQRAHIVFFSSEVARLAHKLRIGKNIENTIKEINNLYLNYIKFINRIYFREVTAQEQGIELYDMLQEKMRIKINVDDLDKEIGELNAYLETREEKKLTRLASWYLPISLLVGVLGMSTIEWFNKYKLTLDLNKIEWLPSTLSLITIVIFGWMIYLFLKQILKKQ